MRLDQIARLQALSENLAEVVIDEANPLTWPGEGKVAKELTQEERGNRYWCKKNAAATMTLLVKVMSITSTLTREKDPAAGEQEKELDDEVAQAERQAMALLERANKGANVH
ncbi:MAG: hypothetical protein HY309_02435 [Pseudomonas fluorescens]|nr:hypothetical protein [Pseudomonas fluorescens]